MKRGCLDGDDTRNHSDGGVNGTTFCEASEARGDHRTSKCEPPKGDVGAPDHLQVWDERGGVGVSPCVGAVDDGRYERNVCACVCVGGEGRGIVW